MNEHIPFLDGEYIEVDEPGQGVLVHGVDVRQIRDREEQDGRMVRNRPVTLARFVDLSFCLLCNL